MELLRCWGEADDGDVFEIAIRPHLDDELRRRWPPHGLRRLDERPDREPTGYIGLSDSWVIIPDVEESGDDPPPKAWDQLEQTLTVFAAHRLDRIAVHAALFAWDGRAVLVPAASGGGKSTLTVAAAEAGATILTDEYALIDPTCGLVTGWTRKVRMLRPDGGVDRLPLAVAHDPMPVALVALVTHEPGADLDLAPITRAEAVGRILEHTLSARDRPNEAFEAAVAVARTSVAVAGTRGEAADAVAELKALIEGL